MTWNIHGAFGRNPRFDLDRVVKFIRNVDPDIVALQEVDSRHGPKGEDVFASLQNALGQHGVGAKSIIASDGSYYGQTLISRWPLHDPKVHDISYGEFEPRRAITAEVSTPLGGLRVVATHLGLSIRERRRQARALLDLVGSGSFCTIVLGDFNDWFWPGSVRSVLRAVLPGRSRYRTFPSFYPLLKLDRIYCHPRDALLRTWTDPVARTMSDHLPVIGEIVCREGKRDAAG